jgi:very-short-patch-repair endonuclease
LAGIHRLARRQEGLVNRTQLIDLGVNGNVIDRRLRAKRLIRVRRGVYRLGPIASPWEPEMAAILAVAGAVLSHESAAFVHGLHRHPVRPRAVHLTITGSDRGHLPGIAIHRTKHLPPDELTRRRRLPVTTPARTILDLARCLEPPQLEQLLARAHREDLATPARLDTLMARYPRRPGTPALRALLHRPTASKFTRSRPERRLLEAFRRAGLPEPETNAALDAFEVDFLWVAQRLVLEVDGGPFHSARPDRRRDYARDARLNELGYRALRVDAEVESERAVALVSLHLHTTPSFSDV